MARVDEEPDQRDQAPLTLVCIVECPACDAEFDHVFIAPEGVFEMQDLDQAPVEDVKCISCGVVTEQVYSGWVIHNDAG